MRKQLKPIPEFRSEDEERDFWGAKGRDSTEYIDWSKARLARFPNIKLSTRSISLRLPVSLLERIKLEANKRDVPYQSLMKMWLAEKAWPTQPGDQAGNLRVKRQPMTDAAQAKRRSSSTKAMER
jgi:predicted DNA binding CopG/RHH family protein